MADKRYAHAEALVKGNFRARSWRADDAVLMVLVLRQQGRPVSTSSRRNQKFSHLNDEASSRAGVWFRTTMHTVSRVRWSASGALAFFVTSSCGGGPAPGPGASPQTTATTNAGIRVSATEATFDATCGRNESGTVFVGAEVEPHLALNPARPANLIATWQQDRWSNGGARGLVTAASQDGGTTWTRRALPFSRCAGGPFERASDPWITIGPTGIAQMMSLSITGSVFGGGSLSAMQVARSADGGVTWSAPISLLQDTAPFFNDKNSMTADPFDANLIYAAWDRLQQDAGGPAYFTRSTDTGITWESARAIYDPGRTSQIIGAEVVVTTEGDVLYFFTQIDAVGGQSQSSVVFLRSSDRGQTWGAPVPISRSLTVGTRDPDTGAPVRDGALLMHAAAGPGVIVVTWQDGRFSNGARDGIAFSQSRDGGRTWSEPVQINGAPNFAAFTPQPQVANDGTISVGYFDLRANTSDAATLPAQYWLTRSTDGRNWTETRLVGPFDLSKAPMAPGAFVGDYVGLVAAGSSVLSLLPVASDDTNNRTDIYFAATSIARAAGDGPLQLRGYGAIEAPKGSPSAGFTQAVTDQIARSLGDKMTIRPRRDRDR